MTIKSEQKLPNITLRKMVNGKPEEVTVNDIFSNRRVVLFAVPGAFTTTCSLKHLPGFVNLSQEIKSKGIDEVVCLSVNDAFVMDAWGKEHNAGDSVLMLADGNADFAKAVGLDQDASDRGYGIRSKRYAMIVDNLTVEKLFVEQPKVFEVSSAEYILQNL